MAAFTVFGETGKMPPDLGKFLADAKLQKIEPYKAFDNVYYVGICWVSAWLITSPHGDVLIDTLYGDYTDLLLDNIRKVGVDPNDIKLVLVTHGHFDHAGGIAKIKAALPPTTRFAMTKEGWREGAESAETGRPLSWKMIEPDIVLTDGQTLTAGEQRGVGVQRRALGARRKEETQVRLETKRPLGQAHRRQIGHHAQNSRRSRTKTVFTWVSGSSPSNRRSYW